MFFAIIREKPGVIGRRVHGRADMAQQIRIPYDGCIHGGIAFLGQTIASNELRWYRSFSCPVCGHVEEDGTGFPPPAWRELLLNEGGRWNLVADGTNRAAAIQVMRAALALSMEEAAAALRQFPVLYAGTVTEAEWLKALLEASGLASQIVADGRE
jgi:hypothetical protein